MFDLDLLYIQHVLLFFLKFRTFKGKKSWACIIIPILLLRQAGFELRYYVL